MKPALALLVLAACAPRAVGGAAGDPRDLVEQEARFAHDLAVAPPEKRAAVWASYFADDGVAVSAGAVTTGPVAVAASMAKTFEDPTLEIRWKPEAAAIAASGDLGFTRGPYEVVVGGAVVATGRYLSIWRRGPDGAWKLAVDQGSPAPAKK